METRVQYAKTSDGVDIAFAVYGDGPPLVIPPNLVNSHLQLEMSERAASRSFYGRLARRLRVIRYDCRGIGMSQRDQVDFSADAAGRDLNAVVDKLGLDRFALYTHTLAGEGPMAFAANNPDRVSSLVCWIGETIAVRPEVLKKMELIAPLQEQDWELYSNIVGRLLRGWDSPEATATAAVVRAGSSSAARQPALDAILKSFRGPWASQIRVPTLLMHPTGADERMRAVRRLAVSIPNAQVLAIPASPTDFPTGAPAAVFYDSEILAAAIADFVEAAWADPAAPVRAPELHLAAMRAILWTDIVDHTPLMERHGDAGGRELLREHERLTRNALLAHGGTEVKAMGDGFMAWFSSTQQAIECAIALQRAFTVWNDDRAQQAAPLQVRIGINAGEPIAEDDDLFGHSVIAAARICREAAGGEIVVSDVVRQLVAGKGFAFVERGETQLKGFEDAVRLFAVRWRE